MTGNIERAALILGMCILFKYSYGITATIKFDETPSKAYCAGVKTGETIR